MSKDALRLLFTTLASNDWALHRVTLHPVSLGESRSDRQLGHLQAVSAHQGWWHC
jgi:hypothetical protein